MSHIPARLCSSRTSGSLFSSQKTVQSFVLLVIDNVVSVDIVAGRCCYVIKLKEDATILSLLGLIFRSIFSRIWTRCTNPNWWLPSCLCSGRRSTLESRRRKATAKLNWITEWPKQVSKMLHCRGAFSIPQFYISTSLRNHFDLWPKFYIAAVIFIQSIFRLLRSYLLPVGQLKVQLDYTAN